MPETVRLVVEAVVAVIIVVEAYGRSEAMEDVAVKYEPMMRSARMLPCTESFWLGEVVPMPTLPLSATRKLVAVEEPMTKELTPAAALMASLAQGVVVPMPTRVEVAMRPPMPSLS